MARKFLFLLTRNCVQYTINVFVKFFQTKCFWHKILETLSSRHKNKKICCRFVRLIKNIYLTVIIRQFCKFLLISLKKAVLQLLLWACTASQLSSYFIRMLASGLVWLGRAYGDTRQSYVIGIPGNSCGERDVRAKGRLRPAPPVTYPVKGRNPDDGYLHANCRAGTLTWFAPQRY